MGVLFRFDMKFPYKTNIPRDVAINSHHIYFEEAPDSGLMGSISLLFKRFLNEAGTGQTNEMARYLSNFVDRSKIRLEMILLNNWDAGTTTYTPVNESIIPDVPTTIGSPASLPLEVAAVSTLIATNSIAGHTTPTQAARRRGRFFFGPLNVLCGNMDGVNRPILSPTFATDLALATQILVEGVTALGSPAAPQYVVFSRASRSVTGVTSGHVNNEWDTQRRRGSDETARILWP